MTITKERDQKAYQLAKGYILSLPDISDEILNSYLEPSYQPQTLECIYFRLLSSAQNAYMKEGVIGKAIGGVKNLSPVLFDFDPVAVHKHYSDDWESVFKEIKNKLKPNGEMRETSRSIWPKYCKTIISAAEFLSQFSTSKEFYEWVDFFNKDDRARPALPMLLSSAVEGIGFALACDFIKELGYSKFGKPDIHICIIFTELGLVEKTRTGCFRQDYDLFKAIERLAINTGKTPYHIDKIFWLIGSGYFYLHKKIGKNGRISRQREKFIEYASHELNKSEYGGS